jgi:hypothetical protein
MASLIRRNKKYYIQFYVGGKIKRRSLNTTAYQIAKDKVRQFESASLRGADNPLPTRTPLSQILDKYVQHIRSFKTAKSAQTDIYYLRQIFGPICDGLKTTSRALSPKTLKRPPKPGQDRRCKVSTIEVTHLEEITTAAISAFMSSHVASRGLAPKTANRYREIICRLFNWAMAEAGVKMPANLNPASKISKYKEQCCQDTVFDA